MRTTGKQCGLAATGVYQPSLRSPWLAAKEFPTPVGMNRVKRIIYLKHGLKRGNDPFHRGDKRPADYRHRQPEKPPAARREFLTPSKQTHKNRKRKKEP
ncbi:hypothetical protein [Thiolapillus sp.]|uniref:hypothetical protein n=1 Tax=Thiolapillus sp. TaxID=2017437 RepID=UPI0025CB77CD|nr:hypothetical protein [Thiolapillus sp.]